MNIYDIAKKAGVSIATVSRVMNNSPKVSEATREKILRIMESEDYRPSTLARGLSMGKTMTVGIICPDIADQYMARAAAYLEKNLGARGYDCLLGCSGYEAENKEKYVKLMSGKKVDALVMIGSTYAGKGQSPKETDYIREAAKEIPVVMINARVEGENIFCAYSDDYEATYRVTEELLKSGRKKILFMYNSESFSARQKMAGYEAALKNAGEPIRGELKFRTRNDIEYAKNMLLEYNRVLDFDAVLASEDEMAAAVLKYAGITGKKVPQDLEVAGYNDSIIARCTEPELTSVNGRVDCLCETAADWIFRLHDGEEIAEHEKKVSCEIVRRRTTDF